jgi:hypothetical protein
VLTLPDALLLATFDQLRGCGDGRRECVAYWCADTATPDVLTRVVHPDHTAAGGGYEVDDAWVMQFLVALHQTGETVRVQIHTHPRGAGHSWIDDAYALVPAQGFLSLVVPDFALRAVGLDATHLVEMTADGGWAERDPHDVFRRV